LILYVCANKQGNFVRNVAELISDITDPLVLNSTVVGAASDEHDDSSTANDDATAAATAAAAAAAAAAANNGGNDSDDDELSEEKLARQVSVTHHHVQQLKLVSFLSLMKHLYAQRCVCVCVCAETVACTAGVLSTHVCRAQLDG
jgi:hypothetical protein